jgi:diguanylate cyclase (GGDEF)-like protein
VNDTYGHAAGDAVLRQASDCLRSACRESDIVVRWGGEEFLVVARNMERACARLLAQNLLDAVGDHVFDLGHGVTLRKTCSMGFSAYPVLVERPDAVSWEEAVALADRCLYAAKRNGRNAWVGLHVGPAGQACDAEALRDIPARVEAGQITVQSSFPPGLLLEWPTD